MLCSSTRKSRSDSPHNMQHDSCFMLIHDCLMGSVAAKECCIRKLRATTIIKSFALKTAWLEATRLGEFIIIILTTPSRSGFNVGVKFECLIRPVIGDNGVPWTPSLAEPLETRLRSADDINVRKELLRMAQPSRAHCVKRQLESII